jgi:hypothetical protein
LIPSAPRPDIPRINGDARGAAIVRRAAPFRLLVAGRGGASYYAARSRRRGELAAGAPMKLVAEFPDNRS